MNARAAVRYAMTVRRALLALAAFSGWCNLAWMARLSGGMPSAALGRGWRLAPALKTATPMFGLLMAAGAAALVCRRTRYFGAAACFAILWIFDFVVSSPGGEHTHLFALTACLVYAVTGFSRGTRDSAERTAWDACCGYVGAAYLLSGLSKLRYGGFGWAQTRTVQLLVMSSTAQARGWQLLARRFMAGSPRLIFFGAAATLLLELLGPVMLIRRCRPYYLAALAVMLVGIYFGMGILLGLFFLQVAAAAAFPFEAVILLGGRALRGTRTARTLAAGGPVD